MRAIPTRFTAWSPSRLADYEQCPAAAKYKALDKLCPKCFKGRLLGGYNAPEVCDTCKIVIDQPVPLARGSAIGLSLERYVAGTASALHSEVTHPKVLKLAASLRKAASAKRVQVELSLNFDSSWQIVRDRFSPKIWCRAKIDVYQQKTASEALVIDWKTGGVDRDGAIRADEKYDSQLRIYTLATMCAFPTLKSAKARLVFTDCAAERNPVIARPECNLTSDGVAAEKKVWENRTTAMLNDTSFSPKPNPKCRWCAYARGGGGPCQY